MRIVVANREYTNRREQGFEASRRIGLTMHPRRGYGHGEDIITTLMPSSEYYSILG